MNDHAFDRSAFSCLKSTKGLLRTDTTPPQIMSTIENYSTGDAVQFMVSTNGKNICGKNRGLGWRTRQVGGYMSDAALQQLSRTMHLFNSQTTLSDILPSQDKQSSAEDTTNNIFKSEPDEKYRNQVFTPASTPGRTQTSATS